MARCALVDTPTNLALFSDDFSNAVWVPTNASVGSNVVTAPDGTATGDDIIEDGSVGGHWVANAGVTVPSVANDITISVSLRASGRGWAFIQMTELTAVTSVNVFVNVSTGTLGTIGLGAQWVGGRATIVAEGSGGWYRVTLTARKNK